MNNPKTAISEEELHGYVDGSLVGERRDEVERQLEQSEELSARVGDYFALNSLLHQRYDPVLGEPVPAALRRTAQREAGAGAGGAVTMRRGWKLAANWPQFAGLAAALVLGVGIGVGTNLGRQAALPGGMETADAGNGSPVHLASFSGEEAFARQSALAHVMYTPDVLRPVEVSADREQDLVQWLSNRLGTSVHPPVLTRTGFHLMGGRLLPGEEGPVAQFMYRNDKGERVTLCISHRKAKSDVTAFKLYQDGPVKVFYWIDGDFGYAVSGGIEREALLELSHDVYTQLADEEAAQPPAAEVAN